MKVTQIGTEAPSNRADIVFEAKRNASKIGKFNVKDGSVSVYVDDIGTDVILGTDGLKHGLRRSKNISTDINSLAILNAGEIIKHSVKINELIPKDKNATSSYVLIGCAENSSSRFIVRSIINTFDNSLSKMDVLYAVKVKESAAQPAPGSAAKAVSSVTDSKISITDLLDYVNRCFPEVLSADVLQHFGHESRPEGNPKGLGESILYSDRDGIVKDATQLTENDLRYLLEQIQAGELEKGTYIPIRKNTPSILMSEVYKFSGERLITDFPMIATVEHLAQNMEEDDGITSENKRGHGLSIDDIVSASKEMSNPKYIVLQKNGRYAEVVSFYNGKNKKVVVSISFSNQNSRSNAERGYKDSSQMNGFAPGCYNVVVTEFEPDSLSKYLKACEVIIYDKNKTNGKHQVGESREMAFAHDDNPFVQKDNTTVSDKSQEEALDKKQSKKKTLKDIEPTNYLNPNRIIPVNNITDKEKYEYLVSEFDKNGYSGRPVVVVTEDGFADDSSSMYSAVTGSHRILAATEAEIDVPVYEIHMNDENAERIMELVDANEDSERARIAKELFEDGIISEEAYSLIEREDELNYENDDVPYSEQLRYSERDFPIDVDIAKTVSDAVKNRGKGGNHILSDITPEQNKAINRLAVNNDYYRGKFTGGKHFFTDNFINHALKEHGDFLVEGLRGQLPITNDDVARNLTAIRQNKKPSLTISSKTRMGNASILTVYKVNGYTLYAEEILRPSENNKVGNLIGHTMYKAPTLSTAAFNTTSVVTQPERQGTVLCEYNNTRKNGLSRGNFISDKAGNPAALKYVITERGIDFDVRSGLIALSSDEKNFTKNGEKVETGYVLSNKPFYITAKNTVFRNSEENYSTKVRELKQQGYDSFIFDYNTGDNYMVAVVNKAQIVTDKPAVVETERHSDRDITLSSRYLLANALESTARNEVERDWLGRYKADIEKYNAEQDKLTTLNAQIKELSFGKGKRDMAKLRQLRNEKIKTENRITIYDKRLLRIETAKPLQNVIEREKTKAKNKALQQGREALEAYKKTAAQKLREEVALRKEPFCRPRLFKF